MDIVERLREAIHKLPSGDHSIGLSAITRHINAAIRHFENGIETDQDCFTDSIYRTNQAYEGSLKEAYRVLAKKDPSGLTPHKIESYLEKNQIVRPRVLLQLSRYRQDYRNPSSHDYKLDFNEDEALLAIVSVCAFAKLLVGQISEKLAFDNAERLIGKTSSPNTDNSSDLALFICKSIVDYLNNTNAPEDEYALNGTISAVASNAGFDTLLDAVMYEEQGLTWDIMALKDEIKIPIEIRRADADPNKKNFYCVHTINEVALEQKIDTAVCLLKSKRDDEYNVFLTTFKSTEIYFISNFTLDEMNTHNSERVVFTLEFRGHDNTQRPLLAGGSQAEFQGHNTELR